MGKRKREVETRECIVCAENANVYRNFPSITSCKHEPEACKECIYKHTVVQVELTRNWSACTCPVCGDGTTREELQGFLPRDLSREIDSMVNRAASSSQDGWRWCPAKGCGHGGIYDKPKRADGLDVTSCRKCHTKFCFTHQLPWHSGLTCEQYDNTPAAAITKTSEQVISNTTKKCPSCGKRTEKNGGCDWLYCPCKHNWRWSTVAFDHETQLKSTTQPEQQTRPLFPDIATQIEQMLHAIGLPQG